MKRFAVSGKEQCFMGSDTTASDQPIVAVLTDIDGTLVTKDKVIT